MTAQTDQQEPVKEYRELRDDETPINGDRVRTDGQLKPVGEVMLQAELDQTYGELKKKYWRIYIQRKNELFGVEGTQ